MSSNLNVIQNSPSTHVNEYDSYIDFTLEITADILLGIMLGVIVNTVADFIGRIFNMSFIAVLLVQFMLITFTLYMLKINSRYLYKAWDGRTAYGILFTTVFLAVQKNLIKFFNNVYDAETGLSYLFKKHTDLL